MNVDYLQRFPNQLIEQRPDECTGETWADITGNICRQPMDAGFSYAAALRVSGSVPTTAGSNPTAGGVGVTLFGALPTSQEPFDATTTSELYEANLANYSLLAATPYRQNALRNLNSYSDISNYLFIQEWGVQLAVRWYESFNSPNGDGSLPAPAGSFTNHCIAAYEDTPGGLRIKPWLGATYGAGGYSFMSQTTFNLVFLSAAAFDPQAWRWMYLARTALTYKAMIPTILPLL